MASVAINQPFFIGLAIGDIVGAYILEESNRKAAH